MKHKKGISISLDNERMNEGISINLDKLVLYDITIINQYLYINSKKHNMQQISLD